MLCCGVFSGDQTLKPQLSRAAIQDGSTTRRGKLRPAWRVSLRSDHRAVTAVEYAVIAGVMVLIVLTVTGPFGTGLSNLLAHVANALSSVGPRARHAVRPRLPSRPIGRGWQERSVAESLLFHGQPATILHHCQE